MLPREWLRKYGHVRPLHEGCGFGPLADGILQNTHMLLSGCSVPHVSVLDLHDVPNVPKLSGVPKRRSS